MFFFFFKLRLGWFNSSILRLPTSRISHTHFPSSKLASPNLCSQTGQGFMHHHWHPLIRILWLFATGIKLLAEIFFNALKFQGYFKCPGRFLGTIGGEIQVFPKSSRLQVHNFQFLFINLRYIPKDSSKMMVNLPHVLNLQLWFCLNSLDFFWRCWQICCTRFKGVLGTEAMSWPWQSTLQVPMNITYGHDVSSFYPKSFPQCHGTRKKIHIASWLINCWQWNGLMRMGLIQSSCSSMCVSAMASNYNPKESY